MKRVLFYTLLIFQAAVILLIAIQHHLIDDYGETIKLLRETSVANSHYYYNDSDYIYIDYEINTISQDIWEIDGELNYQEQVYIVLKPDESGIYHATRATKDKPEAVGNEVVLPGKYNYNDEMLHEYYVHYDIEEINNNNQYQLEDREQWIITVNIAPWGQKSIATIESEQKDNLSNYLSYLLLY